MECEQLELLGLNCRSRTECLRLMLALAARKFSDRRLTIAQWRQMKKEELSENFPEEALLPVLRKHENNEVIVGALEIGRYLATQLGFYGDSDEERLEIDAIIADLESMQNALAPVIRATLAKDFDRRKLCWAVFMETTLNERLARLTEKLGQRLFFVGSKISWADIAVADQLSTFSSCFDGLFLNRYLTLKAHKMRIESLPNIRKYIAERPQTPF
uniref:Glutathione S-transferase n=1 Tax=Ascaris lumbricoides TaxID=6252 RepID=A0A0M3HQX7_ASCLU